MQAPVGRFTEAHVAAERPDLVGDPVALALAAWKADAPVGDVLVVDTDPELADTAAFCAAHGVALEESANCVVVAGRRGETVTYAACLVLASTRLDVNGTVRRLLGARKASFAPMDDAVALSGMEYGGITPIGLPPQWPLYVDAAVAAAPYTAIGSGRRRGKIIVPGSLLGRLPGAEVVEGLARA